MNLTPIFHNFTEACFQKKTCGYIRMPINLIINLLYLIINKFNYKFNYSITYIRKLIGKTVEYFHTVNVTIAALMEYKTLIPHSITSINDLQSEIHKLTILSKINEYRHSIIVSTISLHRFRQLYHPRGGTRLWRQRRVSISTTATFVAEKESQSATVPVEKEDQEPKAEKLVQ